MSSPSFYIPIPSHKARSAFVSYCCCGALSTSEKMIRTLLLNCSCKNQDRFGSLKGETAGKRLDSSGEEPLILFDKVEKN